MRLLIAGLGMLLLLGGCSSLQVETDYDPEVSLGALHDYALLGPSEEGPGTLRNARVARAIAERLDAKGYRSVPKEAADFHVRFRTEVVHDVPGRFSFGFGIGTFSGHTGGSVSASKRPLYDAETVHIDMIRPTDGRTLWSGTAQDKVEPLETPQARQAQANRLVDVLLEHFPENAE